MVQPSVKGTIVAGVSESLAALRDAGRVTNEELEARLEPEELALLEGKVNTAAWYPMTSYARLLQTLGDVDGGGRPGYFVERGRFNARRLMDAGLYEQLGFLLRWSESVGDGPRDPAALVSSYKRNLKLVITLASSIYNVGRWCIETDEDYPGRVWIAVREASAYSEPMRLAAEGFLNECARERGRVGGVDLYTSERPRPDLILFRMTRDVAELRRHRRAGT